MGCFQSKPSRPATRASRFQDFAHLAEFANERTRHAIVIEDKDLEQELEGDIPTLSSRHTSRSASSTHVSSDDVLFPDDESHWESHSVAPSDSRRRISFKHTQKLRVGVLEGTTFLNDYIVVDSLGSGSFGKVKLCLNVGDDCLYAVKVIDKHLIKQVSKSRKLQERFGRMVPIATRASSSPSMARSTPSQAPESSPAALDDLRREVEIMRAMDHPNLVKLYEVIDDRQSGKLLMVVEYCEAGALVQSGQLTPERRMPEAIAQFYFRQMTAGLAYLHEHGVVHGDIKPENVLLSGDATVKIADFGQSRFIQAGDDTLRRTLGTPAYLAPEVCAGYEYKGRPADVWALGVSLYQFIYGQLPFQGNSVMELYENIASAEVPFSPTVNVSLELQDLLVRTLCKDPDKRISSEELARHPWVSDEDLQLLMPGIFSGNLCGDGCGSLVNSFNRSRDSDVSDSSPRGTEIQKIESDGYFNRQGSSIAGGSPGSRASTLSVRGVASPSPADVAAAVFPALLAPIASDVLNMGGSIVNALRSAGGPRRGKRPSADHANRLHSLAWDSMMTKSLYLLGDSDGGSVTPHSRHASEISDQLSSGLTHGDGSDLEGVNPVGRIEPEEPASSSSLTVGPCVNGAPDGGMVERSRLEPIKEVTAPSGDLGDRGSNDTSRAPSLQLPSADLGVSGAGTAGAPDRLSGISKVPEQAPSKSRVHFEDVGSSSFSMEHSGMSRLLTSPFASGFVVEQSKPLQATLPHLPSKGLIDVNGVAQVAERPPPAATIPSGTSKRRSSTEEEPGVVRSSCESVELPAGSPPRRPSSVASLFRRISFRSQGPLPEEEPAPEETNPASPAITDTTQWAWFRPGQELACCSGCPDNTTVLYIDSGSVEVRWEASLPVPLTTVLSSALQRLPGRMTPPVRGDGFKGISKEEESPGVLNSNSRDDSYLENLDSIALTAPQVMNLAAKLKVAGSGKGVGVEGDAVDLKSIDTLSVALCQATKRAETLMTNATGTGSLDNLLVTRRGPTQYIGALNLLDPEFFAGRWRVSAVALTDVVAICMTREGLEGFLATNPLAQVHLRASLAMTRSEVVKLEALERIADVQRRTVERAAVARMQGSPVAPPPWKFTELGKLLGVSVSEAAEAVTDGVQQAGEAAHTATRDVFAMVSKLREGVQDTILDVLLPLVE